MSEARSITLAEIEQHSSHGDLWLAIDGKVYDVSHYMDDHPGGGEIMLNAAGKDGTDDFDDVGHSANARQTLKQYYIGEYAGGPSSRTSESGARGKSMTTGGSSALATYALPLLVVLLAVLAAIIGAR